MNSTTWAAFAIDRGSATPVFEQICTNLRDKVMAGTLATGNKLPPTRAFATELGVSRSTVVTAYEQLVAEGYLQSLQGSGYRVCARQGVELGTPAARIGRYFPPEEAHLVRPFETSQPDMRLFPHRQWAKTVARVCRATPEALLTGSGAFGSFDLREAIRNHVAEWRGIDASPHQVIVSAGSTDALEICIRTLARFGDPVGLEDPGYQPLHRICVAQGLRPALMPIDDQGATLPRGRPAPRLVVLTPSHQFPLGGAMSPNRRLSFIRWARAADGWILEDDYDSEFRYAGRPIPAMAGFDRLDRTIYVGSFSKIFSNTLRLGYVIVPDNLIDTFRKTLRQFGVRASHMPQQALADFISSGEFYRHLRRMRRIYGDRRRFLLERLARDFSDIGASIDHQAGMQIAFHLKNGHRDTDIAKCADRAGLAVSALSGYGSAAADHNGLVLGFCATTEEEMSDALSQLGHLVRDRPS